MDHYEFSWKQGNLNIYAQGWEPDSPKAVLCLVHGFGEHSGRYHAFANRLNQAGIVVMGYDLIGHGKTDGKRGHVESYDDLLESVRKLLKEADKKYHELPKFLLGHSMGGNIVASYVLRRKPDIEGVILSSPFFRTAFEPPKIKIALGKVMRNIYPAFREHTNLDTTRLARDADVINAYENDAMVHDLMSTSLFFGVMENGDWAMENADKLEIPMLICHGTADGLTDCKASEEFKQNSNEYVTLKLFADAYHELFNDVVKEEFYDYMINWIEKRD